MNHNLSQECVLLTKPRTVNPQSKPLSVERMDRVTPWSILRNINPRRRGLKNWAYRWRSVESTWSSYWQQWRGDHLHVLGVCLIPTTVRKWQDSQICAREYCISYAISFHSGSKTAGCCSHAELRCATDQRGKPEQSSCGGRWYPHEFCLVVTTLLKLSLNLLWFPGPAAYSLEKRKKNFSLPERKSWWFFSFYSTSGFCSSCLATFQSQPEGNECRRLKHWEPRRVTEE